MNAFDSGILLWLNQIARRSKAFDLAIHYISDSNLLKGELLMLVIWWLWFTPSEKQRRNREVLLATLIATVPAILLARASQLALPFRQRPFLRPALGFVAPFGEDPLFSRWSAFPSDHAVLFCTLVTGLFFVGRRFGVVAFVYVFVVILLPRVYLGLHYPTDIIAGAAVGVLLAVLVNRVHVRSLVTALPLRWLDSHPGSFYACSFLISTEVATLFTGFRVLAAQVARAFGVLR
jgi:undecaprenyl-diphosphatase